MVLSWVTNIAIAAHICNPVARTSRYLCSRKHTKPITMSSTEKQKAAHKFAADYLSFLSQQEAVVNRLIDRKWKEIEPRLEQFIDKKIEERLSS